MPFNKGVAILRKIRYNTYIKSKHRGILMAEAAEKLNITDLTVFFGGSYAIGVARNCLNGYLAARLDKAINRCLARLSSNGGGAQIR